jgi:hypothetical protein
MKRQTKLCQSCGERLYGRKLPKWCLRHVVDKNLRSRQVECACLAGGLGVQGAVSLLQVDAERHDYEVISQYPFDKLPTWRVIFEATHMTGQTFNATASLLRSHGFVCVLGKHKGAAMSVWHNFHSKEPLLPGADTS